MCAWLAIMERPKPPSLRMTDTELHNIEAGVLTRLNAQRTMVQFKEVPEKAPVQAEAADINIPDVIPGSARR